MKYSLIEEMRKWCYILEEGDNKGNRIEGIQRWANGAPGDSYCCESLTVAMDVCFQGKSPIPLLRACQSVYDLAKKNGWLLKDTDIPQKEDIYLFVNDKDHAHHIGVVSDVTKAINIIGISGNTSPDGKSSNGNGFHEHEISNNRKFVKFVRYPK